MPDLVENISTESKRGASVASSVSTVVIFYVFGFAEIPGEVIRLPILNIPLKQEVAFPVMLSTVIFVYTSWATRFFVERRHSDKMIQDRTEKVLHSKTRAKNNLKQARANLEAADKQLGAELDRRQQNDLNKLFIVDTDAAPGFKFTARENLDQRSPVWSL